MKPYFIYYLLLCSMLSANTKKPNIVFILADDLGWADVAYNGNPFHETPNMDKLIKKGMKFNRAYSGGPNCLPTRACLISGMYSPRTQIWTPGGQSKGDIKNMKLDVPNKDNKKKYPFSSKEELKPSVISLAEVLKKQGYKTARLGKWHVGKDLQGFDISDCNGKGTIYKKFYGDANVHKTLTKKACDFIKENKDQPFFLYLSHWDVHGPIRCNPKYKKKFDKKLKTLKSKNSRKWNTTYAGMITAVDNSVGEIYKKLEELNLADNTLFIFTSDNGGAEKYTRNKPLKSGKGSLYEGGVRVPTFMIWPAVIKDKTSCNTPITSVDFLPTFADISSAKLPTEQAVDGVSILPLLKGKALQERAIFWHYPLYLSSKAKTSQVLPIADTKKLYWRGTPSSMIMKGDWKLIHFFENNSYELYNVKNDISEKDNLIKKEQAKANELIKELKAWQKETKAIIPTKLNPSFKGK